MENSIFDVNVKMSLLVIALTAVKSANAGLSITPYNNLSMCPVVNMTNMCPVIETPWDTPIRPNNNPSIHPEARSYISYGHGAADTLNPTLCNPGNYAGCMAKGFKSLGSALKEGVNMLLHLPRTIYYVCDTVVEHQPSFASQIKGVIYTHLLISVLLAPYFAYSIAKRGVPIRKKVKGAWKPEGLSGAKL